MPWYQYLLLDVVAFLIVSALLSVWLLWRLAAFVYSRLLPTLQVPGRQYSYQADNTGTRPTIQVPGRQYRYQADNLPTLCRQVVLTGTPSHTVDFTCRVPCPSVNSHYEHLVRHRLAISRRRLSLSAPNIATTLSQIGHMQSPRNFSKSCVTPRVLVPRIFLCDIYARRLLQHEEGGGARMERYFRNIRHTTNIILEPSNTANARLHHRGSKLDLRSDPRSTQKTVAPFEFRAGLEIEMKFIWNRRNWRFQISTRNQQPSSINEFVNCLACDCGRGEEHHKTRGALSASDCRLRGGNTESPVIAKSGATVAERLARPPPTKANQAQSPAGSPDFLKWESCRMLPLVGAFFGNLTFPPPSHSGIAPYSLQPPSSALKTSMIRATHISSLYFTRNLSEDCEASCGAGAERDHAAIFSSFHRYVLLRSPFQHLDIGRLSRQYVGLPLPQDMVAVQLGEGLQEHLTCIGIQLVAPHVTAQTEVYHTLWSRIQVLLQIMLAPEAL
ncbi:hypothetical protein PR048_004083 [Dryococelus australis]|uniref:Uncharacterized protein n=1 Tax=Dryococelus australis TaxID=614101 RepID=A0ABQ9I4H2_9NEOP|nr:hypothetical protein PR048_004083 [Dryococelus australis]